ncbi:MAG: glycerol dehydrogenase [Bacteroidota bacterium]
MLTTTIFPGRYVQGAGAMTSLSDEVRRFGKRGFLIVDPYILDNVFPEYRERLESSLEIQVERFGGECSDEEIGRLIDVMTEPNPDFVVGIGGGKTLDTAKVVAHKTGARTIIVPTLASTDAPCSALSVIYTPEGEFKRYEFFPTNPEMVLLDTEVVLGAGERLLVAGIGDALSTWFEADACRRSGAANMTGNRGSMTAFSLARLCYDTIFAHGEAAVEAVRSGDVNDDLEKVVEANTLLSGIGFESGGLASCHAIHNGLTVSEGTHHYYHGEKVAIGVLASLFLTDKPAPLIDDVYSFCERVGLPTRLSDIGMEDVTDDELLRVAERATEEGETIHNEPMTIAASDVVEALRLADREGRKRRQELPAEQS